MRQKIKGDFFDPSFLLSAFFAWIISAMILLIISSIILNEMGCSEKSLGYVSSAISFITAVTAGISAGRKRKAGSVYTALLTATALVTTLLTIGFLVEGSAIEPSAVMSVISFSFTGCMLGAVFFAVPTQKKKRYRPQI